MTGLKEYLSLKDNLLSTLTLFFLPILLTLIAFFSILSKNGLLIGSYHDLLSNMNPYLFYMHDPLSLWNNLWIGGFPAFGDVMAGKFYPFLSPFILISQNIFAVNIAVIVNLVIAFFAFYLLGTLITRDKLFLALSGTLYIFSGAMILKIGAGHQAFIFGYAILPLLYYFFARIVYLKEYTAKNIVLLAASLALMYFSGAKYPLIFAFIFMAIYLLYFLITEQKSIKSFLIIVSSLVLGGLISGISLIPELVVSGNSVRIDPIDPINGGGFVWSSLASYIFGTSIDAGALSVWQPAESVVLIGVVPVLLFIVALIYGKRSIAIPSFFAFLVALIWADGGNTILSFVHFLPVFDSLRCPGRILATYLPILLLLSLYGVRVLKENFSGKELVIPNTETKRNILIGLVIVLLIILFEIPYLQEIQISGIIALLISLVFCGLFYSGKFSGEKIILFLAIGFILNTLLLLPFCSFGLSTGILTFISAAVVLICSIVILLKEFPGRLKSDYLLIIYLLATLLIMGWTIGYVQPSDPGIDSSPAHDVIASINGLSTENEQVWISTTGWPIYHVDFTYLFMKEGIHPFRAYYGYFLKDRPAQSYQIGDKTYFITDYIVDTAYLENGEQNLPEVTFTAGGIPVWAPEYVLPNAFIIRGDEVISPEITLFTPDKITMSGSFLPGDVVVLKSNYYPGWKVNGMDAENVAGMVGLQITQPIDSVTFSFEPLDVTIGAVLTLIGIVLCILLYYYRRQFEHFLTPAEKKNYSDKKLKNTPTRKKKKN